MQRRRGFQVVFLLFSLAMFCAATAIASPAQTFNTLVNFAGTNGASPNGPLVQGTDGNLYGTTSQGGATGGCGYGCGTVFKMTPSGKLTTLYSFCAGGGSCADGSLPFAGLVQATDGNFYGTTNLGGAAGSCSGYGCGTVFKITPAGTLTTLYSFCSQPNCADGAQSSAGLVQATDGNFYGTTIGGGAKGFGTVFKITPSGMLTTLHSFCAGGYPCADGADPEAVLVQATDGNFYGTTSKGGSASGGGTVFKITPSGTLTTLYIFCSQGDCSDGYQPYAGLVQATDGNFYGTTSAAGGANGGGTVFKITPSGMLTTIYDFCSQQNCLDGDQSYAGLVFATDGKFYGTTSNDGANGEGTIFKITQNGTLTALYNFCSQQNCTDGYESQSGLVQGTDGSFYGTTFAGGANGDGTVFSLSAGLAPFVETQPISGNTGAPVIILGTNLTG